MMMMLMMTMLFLMMILIFGNPVLVHGGVAEQRCSRLVSSRGDIGRELLRGAEAQPTLATSKLALHHPRRKSSAGAEQDRCVGDIVPFNAHMDATISGDGILLGGQVGKCDESALTGDPELISKSAETLS